MKYIGLFLGVLVWVQTVDAKDLFWQDSEDSKSIQKDWKEAKKYCHELVLNQKNDWRLPTIKELQSIVDITRYKPAIKGKFQNVSEGYYWSSSADISTLDYAWNVGFRYGDTSKDSTLNELHVRCVREDS
jgi:hypothetical protein